MRFLPLVLVAALAACARVPQPAPGPGPAPVERPSGALIGLSADDLVERFGQPSFQVREGVGGKVQWSANGCVLDAYLYPPESGRGVDRVMHVDARRPSGADMDIGACIELIAP